jgi:hypothetical protein
MSDNVELKTFPSSRNEALTMLYLQKYDLSNLSPEELVDKYLDVYQQVNKRFSESSAPRIGML